MPSFEASSKLRVLNVLQDIAAASPHQRVTASWFSQRTGIDVSLVRNIFSGAARDGLLESHLVAKCPECGDETEIASPEDAPRMCCDGGACSGSEDLTPYVVFSFTEDLIKAAGERRLPKDPKASPVAKTRTGRSNTNSPQASVSDSLSEYQRQNLDFSKRQTVAIEGIRHDKTPWLLGIPSLILAAICAFYPPWHDKIFELPKLFSRKITPSVSSAIPTRKVTTHHFLPIKANLHIRRITRSATNKNEKSQPIHTR